MERFLRWVYETFLTPSRFPITACLVLGLYIYCNPGVLQAFLLCLQRELWPVVGGFLQIAIIVGGIAVILRRALRIGGR